MSATTPHSILYDVIVVGGGPVGLFLACELRLASVSVLVIEQAADAQSPLKCLPLGMRGLTVPTTEALYRRGLLDAVVAAQRANDASGATGAAAHWMQNKRRPAGHFAGIPFFQVDVDAARWPYRLPNAADIKVAVDMQSLEHILATRATAAGAIIRRGVRVESVEQSDEGVIAKAGGEAFAARWLVGCDGGRSVVRKAGSFGFAGTDPELTGYSVEAELADPDAISPGRTYTANGVYTYAKPGTIAMVDFDGGAFHRAEPVTREHVQSVLRRIAGVDVAVTTLKRATTWTDRAYQATAYRQGRVLLAGDAAHVHSPLGGQGLNLGLGDAMNLGWKLASTIRGHAPAGLLDSYFEERHPEGERILDWSRAQIAAMRPTRSSRAMAAIIRDLMGTRDGATYFSEKVWGVSMQYDLGQGHPLMGRSVPDFEFADGTRLGAYLHTGGGLLLDFGARAPLEALARRWRGRLAYLSRDAKDRLGLGAVLVRPDGCVAWAAGDNPDVEDAAQAASRWFGAAAPSP